MELIDDVKAVIGEHKVMFAVSVLWFLVIVTLLALLIINIMK